MYGELDAVYAEALILISPPTAYHRRRPVRHVLDSTDASGTFTACTSQGLFRKHFEPPDGGSIVQFSGPGPVSDEVARSCKGDLCPLFPMSPFPYASGPASSTPWSADDRTRGGASAVGWAERTARGGRRTGAAGNRVPGRSGSGPPVGIIEQSPWRRGMYRRPSQCDNPIVLNRKATPSQSGHRGPVAGTEPERTPGSRNRWPRQTATSCSACSRCRWTSSAAKGWSGR